MIGYYLVAAVGAVVGYLFLIPKYSYFGAAGMTVGVELFMLITTLVLLRKNVAVGLDWRLFAKIFLATMAMGAALVIMKDINVVIQIMIGAGVYVGALALLKGVDKEMVREIINPKSQIPNPK